MKLLIASLLVSPLLIHSSLAPGAEAPARASRDAQSYAVDTTHSAAVFRVKHAGAAFFYGRFDHVEGELKIDPEELSSASVSIRVKADSAYTANERRDQHLRSPDFLDAKQFPWITFQSKSFTRAGEDAFEVQGELTMRGVTKPLTLRVDHTGTGSFRGTTREGYETTFTIQRSDFGASYGIDSGALGDEVRLTFGLEMVEK